MYAKDIQVVQMHLNHFFSHDDKLDFISCVFEVAYADGELYYLEHHAVKKIVEKYY